MGGRSLGVGGSKIGWTLAERGDSAAVGYVGAELELPKHLFLVSEIQSRETGDQRQPSRSVCNSVILRVWAQRGSAPPSLHKEGMTSFTFGIGALISTDGR